MNPERTMRRYRAIKYTLFIFCYVFWVASAALIAVGTYAKVAKEKDVVDTLTIDPALVVMVIGSIMFLLTFFGCFGALRNISCLLKMFLGILVVILLVQVAAGVLGYLFTDKVIDRTEKFMRKAIVRYRDDMDLENVIDFVQKKFQCCGVQSYKDWSENVYFRCSDENPSVEACGVPFSCCLKTLNQTVLNTMCGYGVQEADQKEAAEDIHTAGCLSSILHWAGTNVLLVGGVTTGLLLLEVCLISLAAAQVSRIRKVRLQKKLYEESRGASRSRERKDSYWYPAHFDDE